MVAKIEDDRPGVAMFAHEGPDSGDFLVGSKESGKADIGDPRRDPLGRLDQGRPFARRTHYAAGRGPLLRLRDSHAKMSVLLDRHQVGAHPIGQFLPGSSIIKARGGVRAEHLRIALALFGIDEIVDELRRKPVCDGPAFSCHKLFLYNDRGRIRGLGLGDRHTVNCNAGRG